MSNDFIKFLNDNNIMESIVSTTLSFKTNDLVESLWSNILVQFINRDADGDNKPDIDKLKEFKYSYYGITIFIGKFIIDLIKFMTIMIFIYYFNKLFKIK